MLMDSGRSSEACGPNSNGRIGLTLPLRCRELILRIPLDCFRLTYANQRDPREYLEQVMKATNMSCLTPEGAMSGDCDFLSANMYARSLFGEFSLLLF
jgi:hypothetical protein